MVIPLFITALHKSTWFVACYTTSKQLGIGAAEQSWSDVNQIKDGNQSNSGVASLEKSVKLYSSARLQEAKIKRTNVMGREKAIHLVMTI